MTATSSTMSPAGFWSSTAASGIPHEGNYSSWLEVQEKRLLQEGQSEEARAAHHCARTGMDSHESRKRPPGQIQGAHHVL